MSSAFLPAAPTPGEIVRVRQRNRRLADALARCGLVERSGQGADRMFSAAVREGKLPPNYSASDPYQVSVVLDGQVQDPKFLAFLERLCKETQRNLSLDDLVVLDAVRRERPLPERVRGRVPALLEIGAIERLSKKQLTLSRRFYSFVCKRGEYTRRRGLDRKASKALLLQHIEQNAQDGCPLSELKQVIPGMERGTMQHLLRELRETGQIHSRGRNRGARWFPGPVQA